MCAQLAKGGVRICNANYRDVTGTFGCVVRSRTSPNVTYVLSASHVMNPGGYASRGDAILAQINGSYCKIGELEDWTALRDQTGTVQPCDAAIARITAPELVSAEIDGIGFPVGVSPSVFVDKRLQIRGAESGGVVQATVQSVGQSAPVLYEDSFDEGVFALPFDNLILYGQLKGTWREAMIPGDSGALVLDNNRLAVGLHIARTDDTNPVRASVCTPLQTILDSFKVDLVGADGPAPPPAGTPPPSAPGATPVPAAPGLILDADVLSERSFKWFGTSVMRQLTPHSLFGGCNWQLTADGLVVDGRLERTDGALVTVPRVWRDFGVEIRRAADEFRVPVELIVATICTESSGDRNVPSRRESGGRMSVGLMQTLIGTAHDMLPNEVMDEVTLKDPLTSIRAGTAYINNELRVTALDPPLVACAYNAGDLYINESSSNRWKLRQYPIGSSEHADRFVRWFNDCFATFSANPEVVPVNEPSFWRLFRG